ncbi:MAG: flagellar basal-body MS-ring/collar protein FliF [Nitrospiraceae bacterium]|nr:flagellar basal-body MS-ring/collar protein FliF [Nitrospiraceae bacterium]
MPDFQALLAQIKGMPGKKQASLAAAVVLVIASLVFSVSWLEKTNYSLLYSNLTDEDAGLIMQKLDAQKIPYKATAAGLMVPSDQVSILRLKLAAEGLPQNGGVGFEIFDKNNFSTTDFVQKVDYKRALQGELARTIMAISGIQMCKVQLVIPDNSDFMLEKQDKPRASVLVKLSPGMSLSRGQVMGIVHLVASSVEGLDPKDISVVDSQGYILNSQQGDNIALSGSQLEYQRTVEKQLESRVAGILAPVVGSGNVKVKVAADLDFDKIDKVEQTYDPDSQVARSERKVSEKSTSGAPGGIPGASSNLPGKTAVAAFASQGNSEKTDDTVNYEINEVTSHIENATGVVQRLSVVALVDGTYKTVNGKKQYVPRSDADIKQFEEMVKKAVGYNAGRGDQVKVVNMPFEASYQEGPAVSPKPSIMPKIYSASTHLAPLVLILLIFFFVVRPVMKTILGKDEKPEQPRIPEEPLDLLDDPEAKKHLELSGGSDAKVIEWAKENPSDAAFLIKNWLEEK